MLEYKYFTKKKKRKKERRKEKKEKKEKKKKKKKRKKEKEKKRKRKKEKEKEKREKRKREKEKKRKRKKEKKKNHLVIFPTVDWSGVYFIVKFSNIFGLEAFDLKISLDSPSVRVGLRWSTKFQQESFAFLSGLILGKKEKKRKSKREEKKKKRKEKKKEKKRKTFVDGFEFQTKNRDLSL